MRAFYIVAIALPALVGVSGSRIPKDCHLSRLQPCMGMIFKGMRNPASVIPITEAEMDKKCDGIKEERKCFYNYMSKCSPTTLILIAQQMEYLRNKTTFQEFCQPGSDFRREYLKHAPCIRKVGTSEEIRNALREAMLVKFFDGMGFQSFCCGFRKIYQTLENMMQHECGDEGLHYLKTIWKKEEYLVWLTSSCEMVDSESEMCKSLLPPPGKKILDYASLNELQFIFAASFDL